MCKKKHKYLHRHPRLEQASEFIDPEKHIIIDYKDWIVAQSERLKLTQVELLAYNPSCGNAQDLKNRLKEILSTT